MQVLAGVGDEFFNFRIMRKMFPGIITEAAKNTLVFTVISFTIGLGIGLGLALLRNSRFRAVRWSVAAVIDIFRGLPLLLVIVFIGFGLPIAFNIRHWPLGSFGDRYIPGCLALGLTYGCYIAETIRAGIEAVPRGQMEAARSLGMTRAMAMRKVVLPQAFRINIAPLTNELSAMYKDTALLATLGVVLGGKEILKYARDLANTQVNTSPLMVAGAAYLVITLPLLRLVAHLERKGKQAQR